MRRHVGMTFRPLNESKVADQGTGMLNVIARRIRRGEQLDRLNRSKRGYQRWYSCRRLSHEVQRRFANISPAGAWSQSNSASLEDIGKSGVRDVEVVA